jgi:hypothetical protein
MGWDDMYLLENPYMNKPHFEFVHLKWGIGITYSTVDSA